MRRADRQQDRAFALDLIDRCSHGVVAISSGEDTVLAAEGGLRTANAAFPISCAGDLCGMFLLIKDEDAKPGETQEHLRLGKLASDFLSRETVE